MFSAHNPKPLQTLAHMSLAGLAAAAFTLAQAQTASAPAAMASVPVGEVKGAAIAHTASSARDVIQNAVLVLPAAATGGAVYNGLLRQAPAPAAGAAKVPLVVFMHGSSGLALKAITEWQLWLAGLGIASVAPDSFALPDRLTYKSPVAKSVYEQIHALRGSEIELAVRALPSMAWIDASRVVLAGTSEGATAVARYSGAGFVGRILYSWSCENNYFVQQHRTALPATQPVLNVMSSTDVFFSRSNSWLGNADASGHCGAALSQNPKATITLIPGAPHTLMNLHQARHATLGFLKDSGLIQP